jgi:hypothetical protein
MVKVRSEYKILVGKCNETPFERARHRWEGGMKVDLREVGYEDVSWIQLA